MPDPVDTLSILVEAAVAIAGFSGVVVVFGRRATEEWSDLEMIRIRNLLATSFAVLFLSLVTLLLLHAGVAPETTWVIGSAIWSAFVAVQVTQLLRNLHTTTGDPQRTSTPVVALFIGVSLALVLLNLWNALAFRQFWPFLAAQIWLFAVACFTFTLLLLRGRGGQAA
ncbi:MAG: hypothetical protein IH973_11955 [Myxococcales bacterium]|nr:hypothetical protein [Myxococcales bacterium]